MPSPLAIPTRRSLLLGLSGMLVSPAIVRSTSLMGLPIQRFTDGQFYRTLEKIYVNQVAQEIVTCQPHVDPQLFWQLRAAMRWGIAYRAPDGTLWQV